MASPRLAGGTSVTSSPSMRIWPEVRSSRPAIRRSSVDLPQPEGPTKTTNSPCPISRSAPGMMTASPKALRTFLRLMVPMLLHCSEGEAADELLLGEPAEDQDGGDGHGGGCRELGPEQSLRRGIGCDELGQR